MKSRALIIFVGAAIAAVGVWTSIATAAAPGPALAAKVERGNTIRVSWSFVNAGTRRATAVEIERRAPASAVFTLWKRSTRDHGSVKDRPTVAGTYSYRAHTVTNGVASNGATVSVQFASGATTTTTTTTVGPATTTTTTTPAGGPPYGVPLKSAHQKECPGNYVNDTLTLMNDDLHAHGIRTLRATETLNELGRRYIIDLSDIGTFNHNPSLLGQEQWKMGMRDPLPLVADLLALGSPTPERAVAGWRNSPPHNGFLVDSMWKRAGVGCVYAENKSWNGTYLGSWAYWWTFLLQE